MFTWSAVLLQVWSLALSATARQVGLNGKDLIRMLGLRAASIVLIFLPALLAIWHPAGIAALLRSTCSPDPFNHCSTGFLRRAGAGPVLAYFHLGMLLATAIWVVLMSWLGLAIKRVRRRVARHRSGTAEERLPARRIEPTPILVAQALITAAVIASVTLFLARARGAELASRLQAGRAEDVGSYIQPSTWDVLGIRASPVCISMSDPLPPPLLSDRVYALLGEASGRLVLYDLVERRPIRISADQLVVSGAIQDGSRVQCR